MELKDFQNTLSSLVAEQAFLTEKRTNMENELTEIRSKLAHVKAAIQHMTPLAGYGAYLSTDIGSLGLTDAIRAVLGSNLENKYTAAEVKGLLENAGYDFAKLSSPMASIYKVLSRLEEAEEIVKDKEDGRVTYKWPASEITDEDIPF